MDLPAQSGVAVRQRVGNWVVIIVKFDSSIHPTSYSNRNELKLMSLSLILIDFISCLCLCVNTMLVVCINMTKEE